MFLTLVLNYFNIKCELFSKVCNPLFSLMVMHGTKCQHYSTFVLDFRIVKLLITLNLLFNLCFGF
jgi:hypothetical protein